jgi:hypothetical protein
MTYTFPSENAIELTRLDTGVMIIEISPVDENQEIFLSTERIQKTIEFLQEALKKLEAGE